MVGRKAWIFVVASVLLVGCVGFFLLGREASTASSERLLVFAGAASQPATSEVARLFTERTGIPVDCHFGGSGTMLNQMKMEQIGDLYLPGSDDYMDLAEAEGLVDPATRRTICWLLPVICVPKGNPGKVRDLADLGRPGMRVTIGDPQSVCLGSIAVAALREAGLYDRVSPRIVTFASDCQQVASLIRLGEVDAAVGFDVFQRQSPDDMDTLPIAGAQVVSVPVAVSVFSKQPERALKFAEFIAGPEGKEVFARHGYTVEKP